MRTFQSICIQTALLFAFAFSSLASSAHATATEDQPFQSEPFLWGVANASFQVEGSPVDSGWLRWTKTPGRIADGTNADVATDFWNRYEEDFKLAKEMGANSFRISIAWERIFPKPHTVDHAALQKYGQIILKMREYGLEPMVTLHHFVFPAWLSEQGGVLAPDFISAFVEYALTTVDYLAQPPFNVTYWMTFNEPNVLGLLSYIQGMWPPGKINDFGGVLKSYSQFAHAHVEAAKALRDRPYGLLLQIGIAHHWRIIQPLTNNPITFVIAKIANGIFNHKIIDAIIKGEEDFSFPGMKSIKGKLARPGRGKALDFLGINYYSRMMINFKFKFPYLEVSEGPGELKNDLGWEIYPEGMYTALKRAHKRYKLPIMITENGLADAVDSRRSKFLEDHLGMLMKAKSEGIPIIGYIHWSLTDNFEWSYGYAPRFGLVEVNYSTLEKTPRPSFYRFKEIIQSHKDDLLNDASDGYLGGK